MPTPRESPVKWKEKMTPAKISQPLKKKKLLDDYKYF